MDPILDQLFQLRNQAIEAAADEAEDADEALNLEAGFFEGLLGNWLLKNPDYITAFEQDEGWREEFEMDLPIDWDEFMYNVRSSLEAAE
jgi:hypothetical protein